MVEIKRQTCEGSQSIHNANHLQGQGHKPQESVDNE